MSTPFCPYMDCTAKGNAVFDDCIDTPGASPEEGSVGICYDCGGWWELRNGRRIEYTPTDEELELVMSSMEMSRERFRKFKQERGWR